MSYRSNRCDQTCSNEQADGAQTRRVAFGRVGSKDISRFFLVYLRFGVGSFRAVNEDAEIGKVVAELCLKLQFSVLQM